MINCFYFKKFIFNFKFFREEGESVLRCTSSDVCPAQRIENIKHFVSRNAMNIEGLGDRIITQLVDLELIKDISDLYTLSKEQLKQLDGFADKSASNLIESIESLENFYAISYSELSTHWNYKVYLSNNSKNKIQQLVAKSQDNKNSISSDMQ